MIILFYLYYFQIISFYLLRLLNLFLIILYLLFIIYRIFGLYYECYLFVLEIIILCILLSSFFMGNFNMLYHNLISLNLNIFRKNLGIIFDKFLILVSRNYLLFIIIVKLGFFLSLKIFRCHLFSINRI